LIGHASGGNFQFKEFDQAQPLLGGEAAIVDEALAEVVKRIGAAGASSSSALQRVQSAGPAFGAKTLMVFPAELQQIFFCRIFIFYNFFK
jgi:hypothetical protein